MDSARGAIVLLALGVIGCGGATRSPPDVGAYEQLVSAAKAVVEDHRLRAGSLTDVKACEDELSRYVPVMTAAIAKLRGSSGDMDDCYDALGHSTVTDFSATCDAMDDTLDRYAANGCASSDPQVDEDEATQHCDEMDALLEHADDRARQLHGMMGASMMSPGSCTP